MEARHTHSSSNGTGASGSSPCLLCGRERYCFQISDDSGSTYKVLCQWTDSSSGWHKVGVARDGRNIFVRDGYKQRKKRGKRYPDVIDLKPQTKTESPQWQDVHIPVERLEQGHTVRLKPGCPGTPDTLYEVKEFKGSNGKGIQVVLTVKGSWSGGTLQIAFSEIAEVVTSDPNTGAKERLVEYFYSEHQKVVRTEWTDRRAVYGGKTKKIRPYHKVTDGTWIEGKGPQPWPLYRLAEAEAVIRAGGIVFAVGGEQTVEFLSSEGLTAVCNVGGESGYRQIAQDLGPSFQEMRQFQELLELDAEAGFDVVDHKPLLVIWPDHDETGSKTFGSGLPNVCYKQGITNVVINPLKFWPDMMPGDDAKDWIDHCHKSGISHEKMFRALEFAIDEAIDEQEEELRLRQQRQGWNAPVSYKGEIGRWVEVKGGQDSKKQWRPLANFDFVVERELEDPSGGGLVLQVKRSFDQRQHRVILDSTNYTSVDKFSDAMKSLLGVGVVCNLNKFELNSLIHTRLHEYRTNRQGQVYKRIDRYGQQADGIWVFRDRQYTSNGQPTDENETRWVFNPSLGKDDHIPCPILAPEDPNALQRLVDAARRFFGAENFYQVMLIMGWVVAGLHSQSVFKQENSFPLANSHGEPGSCKTLANETALSLVGTNWPQMGMLARVSQSALYEHGSRTGSLPFIWDDPERKPENEELTKTWFNWKPRVVRGNKQEPHSPMGVTSNHVFGGDQLATLTRFVRIPFKRNSCGDKDAFQELKAAQRLASGAFPRLLQLGYPREAIAALERELLTHLPLAHARIAQSLAQVTYYAQKLVEITGGSEDVLQWVITNLCDAENDAENAGDSIQDFIAKILSLEGQNLLGDWNKQTVSTKDGRSWVAIHAEDVWGLVDKHFKPATYNKKSLKSLVNASGGKVDSVQRFSASRDEVLTYYAALITPRRDHDGNEIPPNLPRTVNRKAWLLPVELFGGGDTPPESGGDSGGGGHPGGGSDPTPNPATVITAATTCYQKTVASQTPCGDNVSVCFDSSATAATKKIDQIQTEQIWTTALSQESNCSCSATNLGSNGSNGSTVAVESETQTDSRNASATNFGNANSSRLAVVADAFNSATQTQQPAAVTPLRVVPTPVAALEASIPSAPAEIRIGRRVRVHCFGSHRDGLTGVVRQLVDICKAVVWLDDASIRSGLRRWECHINWLEVLPES